VSLEVNNIESYKSTGMESLKFAVLLIYNNLPSLAGVENPYLPGSIPRGAPREWAARVALVAHFISRHPLPWPVVLLFRLIIPCEFLIS